MEYELSSLLVAFCSDHFSLRSASACANNTQQFSITTTVYYLYTALLHYIELLKILLNK